MKFTIGLVSILLTIYGCTMSLNNPLEKESSCYVIVLAEPFVKKEIDKVYVPKFQLLDICPKREKGLAYQESKIKIRRDGKKIVTSFDILRTFETKDEAKEYADKYGIIIVELGDN